MRTSCNWTLRDYRGFDGSVDGYTTAACAGEGWPALAELLPFGRLEGGTDGNGLDWDVDGFDG